MVREWFAETIEKIHKGTCRFWIADLCAVAVAALAILSNHEVLKPETSTKLMQGICWGALAGICVQLFSEWRLGRARRIWVGFVTVAVGALGCWFWFSLGEDSPRYCLWSMVYHGGLVSLGAACVFALFHYIDERTLVARLFLNMVGALFSALVFMGSLMLCILAFDKLVISLDNKIYLDVASVSWMIFIPVGYLAFLPAREGQDSDSGRATAFLFWLLLPASLILLAILYLYLAKIVLTGSMPSGELNWFGSTALAIYVFFWLALRASSRTFFRAFVRWGWALLLPVLVVQIVGIVIRYQAYGLTTLRLAGMVSLSSGMVALILAALNRRPHALFAYIALAGLVFTVTPLNIVDLPTRNQEGRLEAVLERNGLLQERHLIDKASLKLSDEDAETIVGAWNYLVTRTNCERADGPKARPTVWYRPDFTTRLMDEVKAACDARKIGSIDLPMLCGIDASKFLKRGRYHNYASIVALAADERGIPIAGYAHLRPFEFSGTSGVCELKDGRWVFYPPSSLGCGEKEIDVTERLDRIFAMGGWNGVMAEKVSLTIPPADAIWELRPGVALIVGKVVANGYVGEKVKKVSLFRCALVTREEAE